MKVLSLFDGISCGRLALARAGVPVSEYRASEIDKHAIAIARRNFPDTIQLGDVRDLDFHAMAADGYAPDLILAGSPCQSVSILGRRNGLDGLRDETRSGLFYRVCDALRAFPRAHSLLENVASMQCADRDEITRALQDARPGKYIEPEFLDSALVSAQTRCRLYWSASLPLFFQPPRGLGVRADDVLESPGFVVRIMPRVSGIRETGNIRRLAKADTLTKGSATFKNLFGKFHTCAVAFPFGAPAPDGARIPKRLRAVFPLEVRGGFMPWRGDMTPTDLPDGDYAMRSFTVLECERLQTLPDGYTAAPGVPDMARYAAIGNGWTVDMVAHLLKEMFGLKRNNEKQ